MHEKQNLWNEVGQALACGTRVAFLRRVPVGDLSFTPEAVALLAASDAVVNFVLSFLLVGKAGSFDYSAIPSFFFHLPLMFLLGVLSARLLARPFLVNAVPGALLSTSIILELLHGALEGVALLPRLSWLGAYLEAPHYYRFFWWWTGAGLLFLARVAPGRFLRRSGVLLVYLALLVAPLWLFPRGDLWVSDREKGESGVLHLTDEVLTAQSRLLDEELARLLPGGKSQPLLYFVGFAGDASQDVFMREVTSVEKLFRDRFGAAGRSVTLVNNPRTATTLPFATAANLGHTLERIGRVMNRENDILFLYLTSHGSADQVLDVENGALELDGVTPEMVRGMLKKSAITWKVIVVSACYAGGFIEPLKDDHTLIITAADATHESFGCSNGEQYTWFGNAYFNDALRHTYSFTAAFARARETIRRWEKEQGETPSNPQIWAGPAMAEKLKALESRLAAAK